VAVGPWGGHQRAGQWWAHRSCMACFKARPRGELLLERGADPTIADQMGGLP
jgi:hypothetical protein